MKDVKEEESPDDTWENIIALVIVVVLVAAVWFVIINWHAWHTPPEEIDEETYYSVSVDNDPSLGDFEAPVRIIMFSDFDCEYCAWFANNTLPALQPYIDNGTVLFVYRDFPLTEIHPKAMQVAKAAGCAFEQEQFWAYHDVLYRNQDALEIGHLRGYAEDLGLNLTAYDTCFAGSRRFDEIQRDLADGRSVGVTGAPTFFVNGKKYEGAIKPEDLSGIIAQAQE